jgi:hypothetical protein
LLGLESLYFCEPGNLQQPLLGFSYGVKMTNIKNSGLQLFKTSLSQVYTFSKICPVLFVLKVLSSQVFTFYTVCCLHLYTTTLPIHNCSNLCSPMPLSTSPLPMAYFLKGSKHTYMFQASSLLFQMTNSLKKTVR